MEHLDFLATLTISSYPISSFAEGAPVLQRWTATENFMIDRNAEYQCSHTKSDLL